MLELRPGCENCNCALPPDSPDAMICSFECTFCHDCVTTILCNVCPNCGGGFWQRPVRPRRKLDSHPASTDVCHHPVNTKTHREFASALMDIPPGDR